MKKFLLSSILVFFIIPLFSQNNPPTAINDSAAGWNNDTIVIYALANDFDVDGNPIRIINVSHPLNHGLFVHITDTTISILMRPDYFGADSLQYRTRETSNDGSTGLLWDTAWIYMNVLNAHCVDSLDVNNINARINNNGNLFWDLIGTANFEVPKGSGKTTIFSNALWVAGIDSIDSLHIAADRYHLEGGDYWPGPVSDVYDSAYDSRWNRLWKIKKSDIEYHLDHCWQPNYVPAQELIDWPGNGDTDLGQLAITAPFKDWNNDGIYDPYGGDFPIIKGDEAIYFIINDDRLTHFESGGNNLGIEVRAMVYAYDCPDDSALWNTLFINFQIYNRSQNIYHDSYVGMFTDFDLGDAMDDYIGTDVGRNSFYAYNGDNFDGSGKPQDYGMYPPAQSVTLLKGVLKNADGIDNPQDCETGYGSYDNIVDNECLNLAKTTYSYSWEGCQQYPLTPTFYYYALEGRNGCGDEMPYFYDTLNVVCDYVFPGTSDSLWCGTGGIPQSQIWSEETAGNTPSDRRCLGSVGPFSFNPGEMQELDFAYVFGRDYTDTNATAAITVMQQRIDSIISYFSNDSTPCGLSFSGIVPTPKTNPQINIYPNPAIGYITVDATGMLCDLNYEIYDILGRKIDHGVIKCTSTNQISVSGLDSGIYVINVSDGKNKFSRKFIKQ
jgi:hypothetical protein